jgi:hypothetical protein
MLLYCNEHEISTVNKAQAFLVRFLRASISEVFIVPWLEVIYDGPVKY